MVNNMSNKINLYKKKDISKSLPERVDTFPHTVPSFLKENEIRYLNRRFIGIKKKVNVSFDYNLYGNAISHIKSNTRLRHIDINININNRVKQVPHKLRILQTYSLAKSLYEMKYRKDYSDYLYKLTTGNREVDNFLVDFLVPKEKFLLAFSRTRCIDTLACLFNVNEKVIHYRLEKI